MIQRIQSLFLLVTSLIMVVLLVVPLGDFINASGEFKLFAFGLKNAQGEYVVKSLWLASLIITGVIMPLIIIFLYRNRKLQMALCVISMILTFSLFLVVFMIDLFAFVDLHLTREGWPILPLGLIIVCDSLLAFALRNIKKDEDLVKSLNRIR